MSPEPLSKPLEPLSKPLEPGAPFLPARGCRWRDLNMNNTTLPVKWDLSLHKLSGYPRLEFTRLYWGSAECLLSLSSKTNHYKTDSKTNTAQQSGLNLKGRTVERSKGWCMYLAVISLALSLVSSSCIVSFSEWRFSITSKFRLQINHTNKHKK